MIKMLHLKIIPSVFNLQLVLCVGEAGGKSIPQSKSGLNPISVSIVLFKSTNCDDYSLVLPFVKPVPVTKSLFAVLKDCNSRSYFSLEDPRLLSVQGVSKEVKQS